MQGVEYDQKGCFLRALELDPKNAHAWNNLAYLCGGGMVQGVEYDQKGCFLRALELDPKNATVWNNLGDIGGGMVRGVKYTQEECFARASDLGVHQIDRVFMASCSEPRRASLGWALASSHTATRFERLLQVSLACDIGIAHLPPLQ